MKHVTEEAQEDTWAVRVMDDLSIREKDFTKRLDWNVNEEISEEILKAAEKYNLYVISICIVKIQISNLFLS